MEANRLKSEMMNLWKNTFHDSDQYVKLVFDKYFDPENIEYYEENHKLISALLGVPYTFGSLDNNIRGLYLCGLATLPAHRGEGIMNSLLENINEKALANGYDFTFLIPASDLLRSYYARRKYANAMYRVEDRYTSVHDFCKDYDSFIAKEEPRVQEIKRRVFSKMNIERIDSPNDDTIDGIIEYITNSESHVTAYCPLLHSPKDIDAIISDNIICNGTILVAKDNDGKIIGLLFANIDDKHRIIVPKIYSNNHGVYLKLLERIKALYPDLSMSVYCYPEETDRRALWGKVYGAANPDAPMAGGAYGMAERVYDVNRHARPYGMARILRFDEILKYLANARKDSKYSILVNDLPEPGKLTRYTSDRGKLQIKEINSHQEEREENTEAETPLSKRDLVELIFRRKDSSNLIMDAFGVPRIALNISLMLD